jgi:hypothetical protein
MFEGAYQQMTMFQSIGQRLNSANIDKIPFLMKCSRRALVSACSIVSNSRWLPCHVRHTSRPR